MKSKRIREVVLKTPWARRLRLNLRTLLKLVVGRELDRLTNLELWKEKKALERRFRKSTLRCGMSNLCVSFQELRKRGFDPQYLPIPQDTVWVPWMENWYCDECFELNRFSEMSHDDFDDPVTREWVKKEFGI